VLKLGLVGFGAFGRLAAMHLSSHFDLCVHDVRPSVICGDAAGAFRFVSLREAANSDVVVLAVPLSALEAVARDLGPHLRKSAIVCDVTSVKMLPAEILERTLPKHADIIGTHPLFGPQSAKRGIAGHKIVVCPIRSRRIRPVLRFLENILGLETHVATVEQHDRDMAVVQGLTHLIARILSSMGPLPSQLTTSSFTQMKRAAEMVQGDSEELFLTIERANPFAHGVRDRFFSAAEALKRRLEHLSVEDASISPLMRRPMRSGTGRLT